MRPTAPHIHWLLLVLANALINAAPIQPNTSFSSSSSSSSLPGTIPTPTRPLVQSLAARADRDLEQQPTPTLFSHLLNPPSHTAIDLAPPRPTLPLVFAFHRPRDAKASTEDGSDTSTPSPKATLPPTPIVPISPNEPSTNNNNNNNNSHYPPTTIATLKDPDQDDSTNPPASPPDPTMQQVLEACLAARAPSLPDMFPPEVGVVRLFAESMYRGETKNVAGCGCVDLKSPFSLHSFVGSGNHTFSFFEATGCSDGAEQPYFQRFREHFDIEGDRLTRSILITQGVLPPIPPVPARRRGTKTPTEGE